MSVPVGSIIAFAGIVDPQSPPPGFLLCDGTTRVRAEYHELYLVIGTLHGAGDGTHTFNLPDHRGRFLRGVDHGVGRDPDAASRPAAADGGARGDELGSVQDWATGLPGGVSSAFVVSEEGRHRHSVRHLPAKASNAYMMGTHYAKWNEGGVDTYYSGKHTHRVSTGGDVETTPISIYVNYLIACGAVTP